MPTTKDTAPTEGGALKKAEAVSARVAGAAALSILLDDDTGEVRTATILGTFGEIPEDFADGLLDG